MENQPIAEPKPGQECDETVPIEFQPEPVAGEVIIEGPDDNQNGKPDWKFRLPVKDKRLWIIIVLLGFAVTVCTKLADVW